MGLLGPLEVRDGAGTPIEVGGARARTLLALLALAPGQVVTAAWLIDRIWGEAPPDGAVNALQALVSRLRRRLPPGLVESHPSGYRLRLDPESVDVRRFERLLTAGDAALTDDPGLAAGRLGQALSLWRGPALADLTRAGVALPEAARLEELRVRATEDRAEAELRGGNGHHLIAELEALVAARPTRERAVGLLMRLLAADGRGGDALLAFERCRTALADTLGADPGPELASLHRRLLTSGTGPGSSSGHGNGRVHAGSNGAAEPAPATNLRAELTSFVGRDEDLVRIGKLIGDSRLTTLTGPGGSGKTRLAVETARSLLGQNPDGVWLVELAGLADGDAIPHAILAALGIRDHVRLPSNRSVPAGRAETGTLAEATAWLTRTLAARTVLLVLDNCEHVIADAAAIAEQVLRECPNVRILATSREPLGITGEALWPVDPLPLPPPDTPAQEAQTYPAVRLLADRAAAVRPELSLDQAAVGQLTRICRALDGMPLAIELAAARLRALSPRQLADRLDRLVTRASPAPEPNGLGSPDQVTDGPGARFHLLNGGSRTALPRHQTLRAVVDWSWELLELPERELLSRLAYFAGGVTLDAAEQVCTGGAVRAGQVLDLLTALVDKSLLVPDWRGGDQPRYRMLQTIKAYGLERLAESGDTERIRRAHADYFVALAEAAEPMLRTGEQREWLRRLDDEHENLQAALREAIQAGAAETAVRLVGALGWYWSLAGHRRETLPLAVQALALPGEVPVRARALAYATAGCGGVDLVDEHEVQCWFETGARLAAQTDLSHPMLRMAGPMSQLFEEWNWGKKTELRPVLDSLLDDPDPWVRATAWNMRVYLRLNVLGFHPDLTDEVATALAAYRLTGDRWGVAFALANAAELAILTGDPHRAVAHLEEAVGLLSELGIPEDRANFQIRLGELRWVLGDRASAKAELAAADRAARRLGYVSLRVAVARTAGEFARHDGDLATASAELERANAHADKLVMAPEQRAAVETGLGHLACAANSTTEAAAHSATAVELALTSGCGPAVARALVGLADLTLAQGDSARAAELLGMSVTVRGAEDMSLLDHQRIATAAGDALGEAQFTECYTRGRHSSPSPEDIRELVAAATRGA